MNAGPNAAIGAAGVGEAYGGLLKLERQVIIQFQGMIAAGGVKELLAARLIDSIAAAGTHLLAVKVSAVSSNASIQTVREELISSLHSLNLLQAAGLIGEGVCSRLQSKCQAIIAMLR